MVELAQDPKQQLLALVGGQDRRPSEEKAMGLGLTLPLESAEALPQKHSRVAHTSTGTKVGVAVAVPPVALAVPAPLREGVGGVEGDLLRTPDPDPLGVPVGVAESLEERDRVGTPLGDLDGGGVALPLPPPLSVAVVVDEVEGGLEAEGEAMVGMWEALGGTLALGGREVVMEGEAWMVLDRVEVMVWVTEGARKLWQHTFVTIWAPLLNPEQIKSLKPSRSQV